MIKSKPAPEPTTPPVIIAFLLDETGSMGSVRDATISGFNEYVQTVRSQHADALLSLRLFSTEKYDKVSELTPLPMVPRLSHDNYTPSGGTPLYDCVARLIRETEHATAAIKPAPEVLFVIMTDGEENSSREYNRERIFQLISRKQEESGWTFVFLGANQDAWAVGQSIGVRGSSSMTYDSTSAGTRANLDMMAQASMRHIDKRKAERMANPAAAPKAEDFFTDEDAEKLGKKRPPSAKP
jgi:hypothetical protein